MKHKKETWKRSKAQEIEAMAEAYRPHHRPPPFELRRGLWPEEAAGNGLIVTVMAGRSRELGMRKERNREGG